MDTLLQQQNKSKGVNKVLLAAMLVGALLVAAGIFAIWKFQSSVKEQKAQALVGALREDSPEFAALTRRIIIENDPDNTWESPLGIGTVMMSIAGTVKNKSDKTLTGLEIRVSVLDMNGKPVKESVETIIPEKIEKLGPQQEVVVNVRIEGFDQKDDRARVQWKVTAIKTE
jgi:hypothetical protein